jgi:hypothetical protein
MPPVTAKPVASSRVNPWQILVIKNKYPVIYLPELQNISTMECIL